ncbi:MAG: hypothetical protein HQL52_11180 [Magnetococcales bacterium]|nr:hypothetical protein [Magnetococcales bacterium]
MNAIQKLVMVSAVVLVGNCSLNEPGWAQESSYCGPMCHVPMAWQGGSGPMAWQGLGPREGHFEQMQARFVSPSTQNSAWERFRLLVLNRNPVSTPIYDRMIVNALRQVEATSLGSAAGFPE